MRRYARRWPRSRLREVGEDDFRVTVHDRRPAASVTQAPAPRLGHVRLFLLLLLSADLAFVGMHLVHALTPYLGDRLYSLETDRGYAEMFQYVKTFWIALLLGALWWQTRERAFAAWMLLFGYLLCDDALQVHEKGGYAVAKLLGLAGAFGLRAQDLGELALSAAVGGTLLGAIALLSVRGSRDVRHASLDLTGLLAILVFFGIVVDMLHVGASGGAAQVALGTLEDGGEMLAMSAACGYALRLFERGGSVPVPLLRMLRTARQPTEPERADARRRPSAP